MKLHHKIFGTAMIAAAAVVSCTDLSDLEQRVDSLENRIAAIETQLEGLNGNIEALGTFAENNKTISNVAYDETSNEWTLTLSDNTTITLDQGSEGNTPVVSLDEDRYWMVDYNDGNGPQYLLVGGEKVQAGTNPVFGVDDSGNWTVSYGGETPVQVTDSEGNPVSALGEGSTGSFFSEVTYNEAEGTFTVTLASDGQSYTLPVVAGFICAIDDVDYDVTELFEYGDSRTYQMTVSGVSEIMTFSPDGWTAIVNEADGAYSLVITAPAQTRAIIADSRTDVTVLAMSASGFATMAKIQVELSDAPIAATATVRAVSGTETENSLTYTVSPDTRTTSWSYIHQLASAEAPTAESEGWTAGSNTTLTIDGLEANTEYTLYVLPYRDETPGEIASATQRTARRTYTNKLDEYNGEGQIEIAGVVYTKEEYGEAVHVTASEPSIATSYANEGDARIYFVDPDANATYDYTGAVKDMIIVGNSNTEKSKLTMTYDAENKANYIKLNQGSIRNFTMQNCKYEITAASQNMVFSLQSSNANCEADFENITFDNNIFYSNSTTATTNFKLVNGQFAGIGNLTMTNNTFINTITTTSFYVYIDRISTVNITRNIAWTDQTMANNCGFIRAVNTWPTGASVTDNIAYRGTNSNTWQMFFGGNTNMFDGAEQFNVLTDDPFAGGQFEIASGTFVPNAQYSQYGVQRD